MDAWIIFLIVVVALGVLLVIMVITGLYSRFHLSRQYTDKLRVGEIELSNNHLHFKSSVNSYSVAWLKNQA